MLDANPGLLDIAHDDFMSLSEDSGGETRKSEYTSENLLRAVIVFALGGDDFRGTACAIAETPFLQHFIRLGNRRAMDYTFLNRAFNALSPATWERMNNLLCDYAVNEGAVCPDTVRTDTTVVETNIHYPTDASLCWDVWRVFSRYLRGIRKSSSLLSDRRFHDDKIKSHYLFATRYLTSSSTKRKRQAISRMKKLIVAAERIVGIAVDLIERLPAGVFDTDALVQLCHLAAHVPNAQAIVSASRRVTFGGETVPASERVFSLFEPHTELIKRGRRGKPVEFGHKVQFTQTKEKFITDWRVFEIQRPDSELLGETFDRHRDRFGSYPSNAAADGGFYCGEDGMASHREKVDTLAVPRRVSDWKSDLLKPFQSFRAGIEGTISFLKRGFRLVRNVFKGFKHFSGWIGACVFGHNLLKLSEAGVT
jgi:IS5 family transposase